MPNASWASVGIAVLSLLYAVVFLGFVRGQPDPRSAGALANALIGVSGILMTVVAAALASRFSGPTGAWVLALGVGMGLLSAAHGAYAAIAGAQQLTQVDPSPTDPRGFATFALVGLWIIVVGIAARDIGAWPAWLTPVSIVAGIDLLALFAATVIGADTAILLTGGLASVILGPAFWIGLGMFLSP